ncbi:MAG: DNA polymerase III subunit alpha, partial [Intestinibacter bartlettii DORA_8_9]
ASFMGYLKGKSSLMIFDRHANLKYKYGNRKFWCRGYYVNAVGRNKKAMEEYIKYYNEERKKIKLKGLTPLQARNQALCLT